MAESGCTKLLVRHLPSQLNVSDKTDFLKHFGAKEVICMERRGKMVSIWLLIRQGSVSVSIEFSLICTSIVSSLNLYVPDVSWKKSMNWRDSVLLYFTRSACEWFNLVSRNIFTQQKSKRPQRMALVFRFLVKNSKICTLAVFSEVTKHILRLKLINSSSWRSYVIFEWKYCWFSLDIKIFKPHNDIVSSSEFFTFIRYCSTACAA